MSDGGALHWPISFQAAPVYTPDSLINCTSVLNFTSSVVGFICNLKFARAPTPHVSKHLLSLSFTEGNVLSENLCGCRTEDCKQMSGIVSI